jgi:hypothetical protein
MTNQQRELTRLTLTSPDTVSAFLDVANAYERLWAAVHQHPSDREFVSGMLGLYHGSSVIPRMEGLM